MAGRATDPMLPVSSLVERGVGGRAPLPSAGSSRSPGRGVMRCTFSKMTLTACSDCITDKFACSQSCNSTKRRFYFILCTKRMSSKLRHNQTHVLKVKMHQKAHHCASAAAAAAHTEARAAGCSGRGRGGRVDSGGGPRLGWRRHRASTRGGGASGAVVCPCTGGGTQRRRARGQSGLYSR